MPVTLYHWIGFNLLILTLLACELWRSIRNPHAIKMKEALLSSAGWIALALVFNGWIYFAFGPKHAFDFFTGYLLEKSLSVDNLFIFLLLFAHFKVPETAKHRVLFYGILGAIILRALLIWGGVSMIHHFSWALPLFGLFLVVTGIRLAFQQQKEEEIEENRLFCWMKKWLPFTENFSGNAFFVGKKATPLLAVLVLIETTDLIFALDSVPAILGITTEPFIVYTSNIFAILGLRSLFFALQGVMHAFHLVHYALAFILVFIGGKMIYAHYYEDIPTWVTFAVLIGALSIAIGMSLIFPQNKEHIHN